MVYTTNITRINYLAASKMIAAAVARADEMNVPQCIAIMDPSGGLVCFARTDGAADLASGPAYAKARVAAERQHPSGALPEEFEVGVAFATGGQYTNLPGGLPIVLDGIHIGGIGVSGGSGDDDLDVARAGVGCHRSCLESNQFIIICLGKSKFPSNRGKLLTVLDPLAHAILDVLQVSAH